MNNPSVCCLIITYTPTEETLGQCLDSLASQTHKPQRILIADNHSATSEVVSQLDRPGVDTLMLPKNYGFSGAINRAMKQIEEEFVLIMNFDIIFDPKFIEEAESEGRPDAAESFRLAFEREKHHRTMFQQALKKLNQ